MHRILNAGEIPGDVAAIWVFVEDAAGAGLDWSNRVVDAVKVVRSGGDWVRQGCCGQLASCCLVWISLRADATMPLLTVAGCWGPVSATATGSMKVTAGEPGWLVFSAGLYFALCQIRLSYAQNPTTTATTAVCSLHSCPVDRSIWKLNSLVTGHSFLMVCLTAVMVCRSIVCYQWSAFRTGGQSSIRDKATRELSVG
jgi:hypothetical protein